MRGEGNYFPRLKRHIKFVFPGFSNGAVVHAANKITNELRRFKQDCYAIDISNRPINDDGYYSHFEVQAAGRTVFVRITVD